jgi:hypothetical protein
MNISNQIHEAETILNGGINGMEESNLGATPARKINIRGKEIKSDVSDIASAAANAIRMSLAFGVRARRLRSQFAAHSKSFLNKHIISTCKY